MHTPLTLGRAPTPEEQERIAAATPPGSLVEMILQDCPGIGLDLEADHLTTRMQRTFAGLPAVERTEVAHA